MTDLKHMSTEQLAETFAALSRDLVYGRACAMIGQQPLPHKNWAERCLRGVQFFILNGAALLLTCWPLVSFPQGVAAEISVTLAPPSLPVYTQPPLPEDGYLWMPGYWAYGDDGYYWVPGVWVEPPAIGLLWTPGYWDWNGGIFVWQAGYWGPHVGFYGGVNYGFGYVGTGYAGGYWQNGALYYNRTVVNIGSVRVVNVYQQPAPNVSVVTRASFHGGQGGTTATPTPAEQAAARDSHRPPTAAQVQQQRWAGTQHNLLTSVNHGKPAITSTQKPAQRPDSGVAAARTGTRDNMVAPRSANSGTGSTGAPARAASDQIKFGQKPAQQSGSSVAAERTGAREKMVAPPSTEARAVNRTASARTAPDQLKSAPPIKLRDVSAQQRQPLQVQRPTAQEQRPMVRQTPTKEQRPENARSARPPTRPEERRESSGERASSG